MDRVGNLIDFTRMLISFNKLSKVSKKGKVGDLNIEQQDILSLVSTPCPKILRVTAGILSSRPFLVSHFFVRWKWVGPKAVLSRWA